MDDPEELSLILAAFLKMQSERDELRIEVGRLQARLTAAERLIDLVKARQIGTSGGVGAAMEAWDALSI